MKIYEEVLSERLFNACRNDVVEKTKKSCWRSNHFFWEEKIMINVDGVCTVTPLDDKQLLEDLAIELGPIFKDHVCNELIFQYYIWHSYSAISSHSDGKYKFGATLYLNTPSSTSDGGLFVWKDDECPENFFKAILPKENMLVLNDETQEHFVTQVSPHCEDMRCTIQIWGN
jgi:hypothetical protein